LPQQVEAIRQAYTKQTEIQTAVHQEQMTSIEQKYADERIRIAEIEKEAKQQLAFDLASSGIALLQAFGSKSEKTQRRLAKISIGVNTAQGISEGVKLGWPLGVPAVAWAIANGKMAMDRLSSSGGSAAGSSIGSAPSVGGSLPSTIGSQEQIQQKRVIEVRGINKDSIINGQTLIDIFESDDDVVVSLIGAQTDAQRRGVI
jgi:hypothetical protein